MFFKHPKNEGRFSDIRHHKKSRVGIVARLLHGRTVDLKPTPYRRYSLYIVAGLCIVATALLVMRYALTKADTATFYASTCLGEWQNPQNAQGRPENLNVIFASSTFNSLNSAVSAASPAQIFCGGFLPPELEPVGDIKRVGITFVWSVANRDKLTEASNAAEADSAGSLQAVPDTAAADAPEPISSVVEATSTEATSSGETVVPADAQKPEPALPDPSLETSSSSPASFFLKHPALFSGIWKPISVAFAEDIPSLPADAPAPATPPPADTPAASDTVTPPADEANAPAIQDEPPATANTIETLITTEVPLATEADGALEGSGTTSSSPEIILGPPLTAELSTFDEASSAEPADETAKETGAVSLAPPAPPSPDENFLQISYSTDGTNWVALAKINPGNWENFTISLPIDNWDDLQGLQVKVEGIPTGLTELPEVFLDGMFVEVEYEFPQTLGSASPVLTAEPEDQATEQAEPALPPVATPPKPHIQIFDQEARHKCTVEPFTRTVKRGGEGADYTILLQPSDKSALYELFTGDLPSGVSAYIAPTMGRGAASSSVYFSVDKEAQQGSFDVVVVYREENKKGMPVPNFCQFNLVIE